MADLYDILNSGILDNWKPEQNRAKFGINTSSIKASVPNNDVLKFKNMIKGGARNLGILSTAVPFYKDFAVPVGNDMYNFIKGNPEKSKLLQFAIDVINGNGNNNVNKNESKTTSNIGNNNGLIPLPELDEISKSDLASSANQPLTKQQAQKVSNVANSQTSNENAPEGVTTRVPSEDNISAIFDYINRLQGIREPYVEALESYIKNYYKNLDQARRADLYFYGANLAKGLDPRAGQKFNTLQNQADIINTLKLISDAKAGDLNAINELQGNMAIANKIDLPQEAAFANKNLLTALTQDRRFATDLEKAHIVDAMRRYGYDTNYRRAIDQQILRNLGNANTAMIYMGGGVPGTGLTQQGTAQPVIPLPPKQSAEQEYFKQVLGH